MKITIITLFPELIHANLQAGVVGRAVQAGKLTVTCINPRDYANDKHKTVDDRPYGGGPGMVLMAEPVHQAICIAKDQFPLPCTTAYLTPQGKHLDQRVVQSLAKTEHLILIAGRYEGIDQRVLDEHVEQEISIGDYILSGGELAANVVIDSIARLLPGVLGDNQSAEQESFSDNLLEYPHYTRPQTWRGEGIPEILASGDHQKIAQWRHQQSLVKTKKNRPDLLAQYDSINNDKKSAE